MKAKLKNKIIHYGAWMYPKTKKEAEEIAAHFAFEKEIKIEE